MGWLGIPLDKRHQGKSSAKKKKKANLDSDITGYESGLCHTVTVQPQIDLLNNFEL